VIARRLGSLSRKRRSRPGAPPWLGTGRRRAAQLRFSFARSGIPKRSTDTSSWFSVSRGKKPVPLNGLHFPAAIPVTLFMIATKCSCEVLQTTTHPQWAYALSMGILDPFRIVVYSENPRPECRHGRVPHVVMDHFDSLESPVTGMPAVRRRTCASTAKVTSAVHSHRSSSHPPLSAPVISQLHASHTAARIISWRWSPSSTIRSSDRDSQMQTITYGSKYSEYYSSPIKTS
jgi:hypothetical protein